MTASAPFNSAQANSQQAIPCRFFVSFTLEQVFPTFHLEMRGFVWNCTLTLQHHIHCSGFDLRETDRLDRSLLRTERRIRVAVSPPRSLMVSISRRLAFAPFTAASISLQKSSSCLSNSSSAMSGLEMATIKRLLAALNPSEISSPWDMSKAFTGLMFRSFV